MNDYNCSINIVVRHSSLRAEEISRQLEWEPHSAWSVGDDRITPAGTKLSGIRKDTMCSFLRKYSDADLTLAVDETIRYLFFRRDFVKSHVDTGGTLSMNVGFNGQFHSGLTLSLQMLKTINDLGLQLSFECFPDG